MISVFNNDFKGEIIVETAKSLLFEYACGREGIIGVTRDEFSPMKFKVATYRNCDENGEGGEQVLETSVSHCDPGWNCPCLGFTGVGGTRIYMKGVGPYEDKAKGLIHHTCGAMLN